MFFTSPLLYNQGLL